MQPNLSKLKTLALRFTSVTYESIASILVNSKSLSKLDVGGCTKIETCKMLVVYPIELLVVDYLDLA